MNKRSSSERAFHLERQNQDLKSKIQRSKPILVTIYDKIKRKQKVLYDKIDRDRRVITEYKNIAKDFKQLYQNSVDLMHRGKFFDKFNNAGGNFIRTKLQAHDLQNYKSKSVYQQYRERIDKKKDKNKSQKNPEIEMLKRQKQQLKNTMLEGINKLKMVREKSQKSLKKTKSNNIIKTNIGRRQPIDQMQLKKKLIQKNRQRLSRMN